MCHASVLQFTASAITRADVEGLHVAEAGAYDVNGSPRPHVTGLGPASYTGFDSRPGPGVDVVADAADLPRYGTFSLIVSTHVPPGGRVIPAYKSRSSSSAAMRSRELCGSFLRLCGKPAQVL